MDGAYDKPSRSSLRSVSVSMRLLIPLIERSSSLNRTGPCATATRMPMLSLPET